MIDISNCKSLNDICILLYGKKNYTNREKVKKYLHENGIKWDEWLISVKQKPNTCLHCGKEITGKNRFKKKFCNSSCAASYNNIHRKVMSNDVKIKISNSNRKKYIKHSSRSDSYLKSLILNEERVCLYCGKKLKTTQEKFCCPKCCSEYKKDKYIENWKNGKVDGLSSEYNLSNYIRNFLLKKHNFKCERCGWGEVNEFTNTTPLEIHHIDGDYRNNNEENLQVLCPNCHSLTNTYKSHNKQGRKKRKKYT